MSIARSTLPGDPPLPLVRELNIPARMKQTLRSSAVSYSLMEHLGEGLNSTVYKAVRFDPFHHLKQTVALKVLKSKNLVDIWKSEFASLEKVACKHCVRVFGFEWVSE